MVARLKRLAPLFLLAVFSSACHSDAAVRRDYTPVEYLKNYALAACLADAYKSPDAVAAANGYMELGSFDIDAYNAAAMLARQFLAREYASRSGEKLNLMKCIDLFHSPELDALARTHDNRK